MPDHSDYLLRPLRSIAQARRDIAANSVGRFYVSAMIGGEYESFSEWARSPAEAERQFRDRLSAAEPLRHVTVTELPDCLSVGGHLRSLRTEAEQREALGMLTDGAAVERAADALMADA